MDEHMGPACMTLHGALQLVHSIVDPLFGERSVRVLLPGGFCASQDTPNLSRNCRDLGFRRSQSETHILRI